MFSRHTHVVHALDDVSLDIPRGSTVGVVGESGSGKSTLGRCILRLTDADAGQVIWHDAEAGGQKSEVGGQPRPRVPVGDAPISDLRPQTSSPRHRATEITALTGDALRTFRRRMQVIFQDPFNSLNPARPVWQVVGEGLFVQNTPPPARAGALHSRREPDTSPLERGVAKRRGVFARCDARDIRERAALMLESVGLTRDHLDRLPHEFSGGQRQRIAIARALIVEPEFIVCDEVTSALDTRTQAQVLELLRELQARTGVTLLFISHDLHTVAAMSREVVVMRTGRIVECGAPAQLFASPAEPYTRELVAAVPNPDPRRRSFRSPRPDQP